MIRDGEKRMNRPCCQVSNRCGAGRIRWWRSGVGISAGRRGRSEGTDDQLILKIERAGTRVIHPCSAASWGGTGMARTEVHRRRAPLPLLLASAVLRGQATRWKRWGCSCRIGRISSVIISEQIRQRNKRRRNVKVVGISG